VPTCLLVRHGQSTANADGLLAGWLPGIRLDDKGMDQAAALGRRLAVLPVARIVTSPLERCQETAAAIAEALRFSGQTQLDDGIGECRYGAWTGRLLKELAEEPLWRTVQDAPTEARFPDSPDYPGETLVAMQQRAVETVRRHDAEVAEEGGPHAVWVAVTHGDVIKSVLADAAGTALDNFQRFQADPASVSVVRYTERRPFLVATNDIGSDLARLMPPAAPEAPEGDAVVGGGSAPA
jgi:probable phosphomutase (TIGR03848 family)